MEYANGPESDTSAAVEDSKKHCDSVAASAAYGGLEPRRIC